MYKKEFDFVLNLLKEVRPLILSGYNHEFDVEIKEDGSPVTNIDKAVDSFLRNALKEAFPNYSLLTEETLDDKSRLDNDYVWIIDPIDGTREFVAHQYEFVTNIALVYKHEVVLSFILEPLSFEIYYAIKGEGAYLYKDGVTKRIHVSNRTKDLIALQSPYYQTGEEIDYLKSRSDTVKEIAFRGAAYKACLIASGEADICIRFKCKAKEWDTAAPQLIVEEAGGCYLSGDGSRLTYNNEDVRIKNGYIILNKKENYFF